MYHRQLREPEVFARSFYESINEYYLHANREGCFLKTDGNHEWPGV
jgi:hypothetical protein